MAICHVRTGCSLVGPEVMPLCIPDAEASKTSSFKWSQEFLDKSFIFRYLSKYERFEKS